MKGVKNRMEGDEMSRDEMINNEINYYVNLLRIKACEEGTNKELNYQIKVQENKLHALGVNTENFQI